MKISYNWLQDFIDLSETPQEVGDILTQTGLEVEGIEKVEKIRGGLAGVVVGEVLTCVPHPNADKLKITTVDIGLPESVPIVCGAPNVAAGQNVLVATVNSTIHPTNGEPFKIKKTKIRGEVSLGMICAEDELGLGTSHEGILVLDTSRSAGTPAIELFESGEDYIFEIGLTPNRGDATSHMGTARDLKAHFKKELNMPDLSSFEGKGKNPISVEVQNEVACPRYAGLTIRGVEVRPSPDWLQWKLRSIGLEPINNVVDITNYVCHAVGQPMHAFDAAEIIGNKILVKTLDQDTPFTTLDGKERKLHSNDLMICDGEGKGMCIAGVFGGSQSGIKETTKDLFLESAYFSADYIRATAQRHTLSTDASFRYERGTDPNRVVYALKLAASMIQEIAGGTSSDITDHYPSPIEPWRVSTTFSYINRLIGVEIAKERIIEILQYLDIDTEEVSEDSFTAVVPPYRSEVTRPADLVEEVLRIVGFNSIALDEDFSASYLASFNEHEPYKVQEDLSKFLAGAGFSEILTNSLTSQRYLKKFPMGKGEPVEMLNPSSEELTIMKMSPLYTALESIVYNINRKNTNLKFFEFSRSYHQEEGNYLEQEWLSLYITGSQYAANWLQEPRSATFHDLSTSVTALLKYAGIRKWKSTPVKNEDALDYGISITARGKTLGKFGKIKAALAQVYGVKQEIYYAELAWPELLRGFKKDIAYQPIPKFPEVKRDLSLVIDKQVSYAEIEQLAYKVEKNLLQRINLFSVYEGDKIEKGKKAYAISFFLQDKFKTLTDKQIDKSMNGLMSVYERELGAIIRK